MNILVINCGSSSLKYQLINSDTEAVLAKGLCERIGIDGSQIKVPDARCSVLNRRVVSPRLLLAIRSAICSNSSNGAAVSPWYT